MTVNIDPSEVRNVRSSVKTQAAPGRLRLPLRATLIGALGAAGLVAFSVGAFSFFSNLADPRARTARIAPVASSWPELKDGVPALAGETAAPPTINLPRPIVLETAAEPVSERAETNELPAPQLRTETPAPADVPASSSLPAPLPIGNAPTLEEARTVPVVAPARAAAPLAPARAETVKARAGQPSTFVSLEPKAEVPEPETPARIAPSPKPEKPVKAAAKSPEKTSDKPERKAAEKKPPVRKTAAARASGEAGAPEAGTPGAAPEEGEVPGVRQLRDGFKAIGGLFGKSETE